MKRKSATELKRDVFTKLRTDPELADWVFIVQGQEIRAPGNVMRAASEVLFDMLGECASESCSAKRCPLPDFITPQGFNAILDFILSPTGAEAGPGLLTNCKMSREAGEDTYCRAAVEAMVAADHLRVPGLIERLSADVMRQACEGRINVVLMWSLLDAAGAQDSFSLLLGRLRNVIVEDAGYWLREADQAGVPFSACLSSSQLAELISTAQSADSWEEPRWAMVLFSALQEWCAYRQRQEAAGTSSLGPNALQPSGPVLDANLKSLFRVEHLCRGMTAQFLKTTVLPSGLVPRDVVLQAFQDMACTAEALGINFISQANIMSEVYLHQSYVTWEVRPRKAAVPGFTPSWPSGQTLAMDPSSAAEDWDGLMSERFALAGRFWKLQTACQEENGRQHFYLYLLPASSSNLWGNQTGHRIDCNLVLLRQAGVRSGQGIGDVVKRVTWTYMKEEVAQQMGRGHAMTDMDSVLSPANRFISSSRSLLVQVRLHRDEPLFLHAAKTKMHRTGEDPNYPFPWDPEKALFIGNA